MSKRTFLASELVIGFNPANGTLGKPKGLEVFEKNGKKYFKVLSAKGTSNEEYFVGKGEIVLDTISGKVFFRPTAEEAARDDKYAIVVPPNAGALNGVARDLVALSGKPDKFFYCGGKPQGFRSHPQDIPDMGVAEAIAKAKAEGYKKIYVL